MTIAQFPLPDFIRPSAKRTATALEEIIVDNFAGGGGASTGIELALGRSVDIAINHDPEAIEMHARNHPQTKHLCESVWDVDPAEVCAGRPVGVAWFSPDCKHFSRAKGAKPVSKKIRGLAWVAVKWAKKVRPRVIFLENVREFQEWGPLGVDNRPCPKRKGETFKRFVRQLERLGYVAECRVLNAADYGAPTHRRRLFLIARCDGAAIVWPEPTHGPVESKNGNSKEDHKHNGGQEFRGASGQPQGTELRGDANGKASGSSNVGSFNSSRSKGPRIGARTEGTMRSDRARLPYRTAAECIDWSIPCPSIFERKRPLAEKTLRRIAMGLKRYVLDNPKPFIVNAQHGGEHFRGQSLDKPLSTVTAKHGYGVVAPHLVEVANSNWSQGHRAADTPMPTVTAQPKGGAWALAAPYMVRMRTGGQDSVGVDRPMQTICSGGRHTALVAAFLAKHYGGVVGHGVERPIGTVTAVDHHSLTTANLIKVEKENNDDSNGSSDRTGEHGRDSRGPNGPSVEGNGDPKHRQEGADRPQADGEGRKERVPLRPLQPSEATVSLDGSQTRVGRDEWGYPVWEGNQPQGQKQGKQSPAESGARDTVREPSSCVQERSEGADVAGASGCSQEGSQSSEDAGREAAFLTKWYGTATGAPVDAPMPTVTAGSGGGHMGEVRAFLIKYFGCGVGQEVSEPLHTVTTKDRFGLVTIDGQYYQIADIGLRMLTPRELLRAQFGPELAADYLLPRTASAAVAKIGNSVAPLCAAAIVRANCPELIVQKKKRRSA